MTMPRFSRFLGLAREYTALIVDLCGDPDVLSRVQLLHYLEHHAVPAAEKDALIEELCQAAILLAEHDQGFTVNPAVVDLVNYYERRGRLISATFLRDQMLQIATLTDKLQLQIFAAEADRGAVLDTIDDLYRRVRAALSRSELYVPDDIAALFVRFAGHGLLAGQPPLVEREDDPGEVRQVIALIAQHNAGLEQEIVAAPAL